MYLRLRKFAFNIGCFGFLIAPLFAAAQPDLQLRAGFTVKHNFTQRIETSVNYQNRREANLALFTGHVFNLNFDYELSSKFSLGSSYRLSVYDASNYWSKRHRGHIEASYKFKVNPLTITLRSRLQAGVQDVMSSEKGKLPTVYNRNRANVKLSTSGFWSPFARVEQFLLIKNADERFKFARMRYTLGLEYAPNRLNSFEIGAFLQNKYGGDGTSQSVVVLINYSITI
ncbi:MAG: hypothetical protein RIQ89_2197 [Bacteroidota bacterium]|jgi:hypothetical protein